MTACERVRLAIVAMQIDALCAVFLFSGRRLRCTDGSSHVLRHIANGLVLQVAEIVGERPRAEASSYMFSCRVRGSWTGRSDRDDAFLHLDLDVIEAELDKNILARDN